MPSRTRTPTQRATRTERITPLTADRSAALLETKRLLLRPYAPSDLEALLAIYSRPDVVKYLYYETRDEDEVRDLLTRKANQRSLDKPGDILALAVVLKANGRVIGDVILRWLDNEHHQGEIGYVIHPDHQGKGYGKEAVKVLLRVAFEDAGLHRVIGSLEARNEASAGLMESLGMRREAHFVENEFVKGEWQSEVVYAILASEWGPKKKSKR
jgi:RimJ/RimL family protein N-acetyltransferase